MFYLITIRCFYQLTVFFLLPRCYTMQTSAAKTTNMWAWADSCTLVCFRPCTHLSYPWSIDHCRLAASHSGNLMFTVDAATSVTTSLICNCETEVVPLQTMLPSQQQTWIQVVVEVDDGTRKVKAKLWLFSYSVFAYYCRKCIEPLFM